MGSIGITLIVFIVTLLALHVLDYYKNLSKGTWFIWEYISLGVAVIGLVGITTEARKLRAELEILPNTYLQGDLSDLKDMANFELNRFNRFVLNHESGAWGFDSSRVQEDRNTAHLLEFIFHQLDTTLSIDSYKQILDTIRSSKNINRFGAELDFIERRTNYLYNITSKQNENMDKKKDTSLEKILTLFSPFLIAIALAIQISKVSAQRRRHNIIKE